MARAAMPGFAIVDLRRPVLRPLAARRPATRRISPAAWKMDRKRGRCRAGRGAPKAQTKRFHQLDQQRDILALPAIVDLVLLRPAAPT